jgi:hypothetical protein
MLPKDRRKTQPLKLPKILKQLDKYRANNLSPTFLLEYRMYF